MTLATSSLPDVINWRCPACGQVAVVRLSPPLADGTNLVCRQAYRGCGTGYALDEASQTTMQTERCAR